MTDDEVRTFILRDIRDPSQMRVGPSDLAQSIAVACFKLGMVLKRNNPNYFIGRESLSSYTNIFTPPSDMHTLTRVYDLGTNAGTITGAADNGSTLIRITLVDHGFSTGDIITIHSVTGTTEANGTWQITVIDDDTFDLINSTFANAYVSGGKAFKEENFAHIRRRPSSDAQSRLTTSTRMPIMGRSSAIYYPTGTRWYQREDDIVVDDTEFENDILVEYTTEPDAVADIPSRFHYGIISWGVIDLILLPKNDAAEYPDMSHMLRKHTGQWQDCLNEATMFKFSTESENLSDERRPKRRI